MQLVTSVSKFSILALLICSLFIALDGGNSQIAVVSSSSHTTVDEYSSNVSKANIESHRPITTGSIWSSIRSEFKLDHRAQSTQVKAEIRKLLADQGKFYEILKAAGPYIYFIYNQTQARGLPAELALIPVIESEFNPNDKSKKGATGLWQLMPGTARELGVKVKSGYDGRRNVIASTKAALAYFKDLGNMFNGNWYLAIAAYNCGQVKVAKVKRRIGSESFWHLPLPKETRQYVPKLLAVAEIVKNPAKYGIELPTITNEPYFAELKVNKSVDLAHLAKLAGISIETLQTLNPDYKRKAIPDKNGAYSLLVPVKKAPVVKKHLADNVMST